MNKPNHSHVQLTRVEREAHAMRQQEPKCYQCVNGCQVFELWTCDANLTWPKCQRAKNGYRIVANNPDDNNGVDPYQQRGDLRHEKI